MGTEVVETGKRRESLLLVHHQPLRQSSGGIETLGTANNTYIHTLTFVVRVPDAEMVGLGFNPWVGHLGPWEFPRGRSQRNCTLAKSKDNPGTLLPISQRWLECVDDELSALAVKFSFSSECLPDKTMMKNMET